MDEIMDATMIDVKKAIEIAAAYLLKCYPDATKVHLEETEVIVDKNWWVITLSYEEPDTGYIILGGKKKFKILTIEAEKGEVLAMKIREFK
jgi:hypothetical protein